MKITNKHNLPAPIVKAAEASVNSHPPKANARSVTQLVSPPRIFELQKRFWDELEQDVVDLIKPLIGTAWHAHLAKFGTSTTVLAEYPLAAEVGGWNVSGTVDLYDSETKTLTDYKTASVFSYLLGEKEEYTAQLNCYRWLLEKSAFHVEHMQLAYTFTDWQWRKGTQDADYPEATAKVVPVDMWSMEDTEAYIKERLNFHQSAESYSKESLPDCDDKEMWAKKDSWAVKKAGRKSALRVLDSEEKAIEWKSDQSSQTALTIEHRLGERTRCDRFCVVGKNGKCSQWEAYKKG